MRVEPARPELMVVEGGERPETRRPLVPALELLALGAGLTLTIALLARVPSWFRNLGTFQALFALAFAFYGLAVARLRAWSALPGAGLAVLAVALATRAALLPVPPSLSGDLYRYVWEGRVVVAGGDPYRQSPSDPALAPLRDASVHPQVQHAELASIYPPLGMAGFALVAALSPTVGAFKLWVVLHDLAIVLLLLAWARQRGESAAPVLAYAWNPLVLVEYAGTGHNDPTAIVWLVLALMLVERRPVLSGLALATGALVKLAPLVVLALLVVRWPWRARLACLALLVPGLAWFSSETRQGSSGLTAYWESWRNNELFFHLVERITQSMPAARAVALLAVGLALAFAIARRWRVGRGTRLALGAGLLAGPVLHPWYLGWRLALEPLGVSWPWLLLSLTAILNYGFLRTPDAGRDFHPPLAWRWLEYGIPLAVGAGLLLGSRRLRVPLRPFVLPKEP